MAVDIRIEDVTNATEVNNGTGIFDKLIGAAFLHINDQVDANRLTQGEAGKVYAAAIQSAMAQSIQFILQENISEKQAELVGEQIISEQMGQQALKAKALDENGANITVDSLTLSNDPSTQHYWKVKGAEEDFNKAVHETEAADLGVDGIGLDNAGKKATLRMTTNFDIDANGDLVTFSAIPDSLSDDPTWLEDSIPKTKFEADLKKLITEAAVANNTAAGYKADSYYKVYRSLQELMFALANSGIIDEESETGTYARILTGMEKAMNGQISVWGSGLNIDLNGNEVVEAPTV